MLKDGTIKLFNNDLYKNQSCVVCCIYFKGDNKKRFEKSIRNIRKSSQNEIFFSHAFDRNI